MSKLLTLCFLTLPKQSHQIFLLDTQYLQQSQAGGPVNWITSKAYDYSSPFDSACLELPYSRLRAFDLVSLKLCLAFINKRRWCFTFTRVALSSPIWCHLGTHPNPSQVHPTIACSDLGVQPKMQDHATTGLENGNMHRASFASNSPVYAFLQSSMTTVQPFIWA